MKIVSLNDLPPAQVSHNAAIGKQVLIEGGELGPITYFSRAVFPPGEVADAHSHRDMGEVFFIQEGRGEIEIDGTVHAIEAGSCIKIVPGEVHELRNTGSDDMVVLYFGVLV